MFVFPEDKPVISGVRSIYVRIPIFIKYYQEQIETGCIHLHNAKAEGLLFFSDNVINSGSFLGPGVALEGQSAIEYISGASSPYDFTLAVFAIAPEQIRLWAGLSNAKAIHSNLSTEFTDLKKLIAKLTGQNLTGYIDITIKASNENGRIFLANGRFLGGNYSWIDSRLSTKKVHIEELISKTEASEGVFTVFSISTTEEESPQLETISTVIGQAAIPLEGLEALEELLTLAESIIAMEKRIKGDFHTLLKKKFVQYVEKFPFLDPFAGEFEYHGGKITFTGDAEEKLLANGLIVTTMSLLDDLQLKDTLQSKLLLWRKKYGKSLGKWAINL
ncbi:MAG: hypothetical protein V2B20_26445 [Pseudomonadota bacterium]